MANSDKNILITPARGSSSELPNIRFVGFGNSSLYLEITNSSLGTLNFKSGPVGAALTLFTIDSDYSSNNIFTSYTNEGVSVLDFQKNKITIGSFGNLHSIIAPTITVSSHNKDNLPISPEKGTLIYDKTIKSLKCYNGKGWLILSEKKDGLTPETAAESASQILYNFPNSEDGVYWYKTPEMNQPIQTFTDMTRDGGGWIMISRWGGHNKTLGKVYSAEALNKHLLRRYEFLGYDTWGRLSRRDMNCLWNYSYGTCRIHFNNQASTASAGIYFQRKITNRQNFDLWQAHYNPLVWSDNNEANSYQATGGGTYYEVTFSENLTSAATILAYNGNNVVYNPFTNDIIGGTAANANMGWWDKASIGETTAAGLNRSFIAARHMGFFGDINQGNQWIFTNNPADARFGQNEDRESMVFLRT